MLHLQRGPDDRAVGTAPGPLSHPAGATPVSFTLERPDGRKQTQSVTPDRDRVIELEWSNPATLPTVSGTADPPSGYAPAIAHGIEPVDARTFHGMNASALPRSLPILAALVIAFGFAVGAGCVDEEEGGPVSCEYEEARTGCSGGGFGDYEYRCTTIDNPKEGFTAADLCDEIASATTHCESSCCLSFRYRNFNPFNGSCERDGGKNSGGDGGEDGDSDYGQGSSTGHWGESSDTGWHGSSSTGYYDDEGTTWYGSTRWGY